MLSRYQRTIVKRYVKRKWHNGLSHLWYSYHKKMFGSFISRGLKLKAYKRFSQLLTFIKNKERIEPRYVFLIACMRSAPSVVLKKVYRGSRVIIKPVPLSSNKQPGLVVKWFVKPLRDSHSRRNISVKKLFDFLLLALRRRGDIHKRKMDVYKIARANRKPKINR